MYFWHTGLLTGDADKMIGDFCNLPGVGRGDWKIRDAVFPPDKMVTGSGGELRVAYARVNGVVVELLQPLDATSYHAAEFRKKGPGLHHIAYVCPDDQDEAVMSLLEHGGKIVWEFQNEGERAVYVETADGMIFELINTCPFMPE